MLHRHINKSMTRKARGPLLQRGRLSAATVAAQLAGVGAVVVAGSGECRWAAGHRSTMSVRGRHFPPLHKHNAGECDTRVGEPTWRRAEENGLRPRAAAPRLTTAPGPCWRCGGTARPHWGTCSQPHGEPDLVLFVSELAHLVIFKMCVGCSPTS